MKSVARTGDVAIVGVEQSGKTALMVSWGWHYQRPDKNGYCLMPDPAGGHDTLDYVCTEMNRMRGGKWPNATSPDSVTKLDWILCRNAKQLAGMSFIDFGGELYRQAFCDGPKAIMRLGWWNRTMKESPVDSLRRHVKNCKTLVVLVNLGDVINDPDLANARTRQMVAVVKCLLDVMKLRAMIKYTAIAFSQSDLYADTLASIGSLSEAYRRYLPTIAAVYPSIPLFAVSAVNQTVPGDDGFPVPVPGFSCDGLDRLTEWIAWGFRRRRMLKRFISFIYIAILLMLFAGGIVAAICDSQERERERIREDREEAARSAERAAIEARAQSRRSRIAELEGEFDITCWKVNRACLEMDLATAKKLLEEAEGYVYELRRLGAYSTQNAIAALEQLRYTVNQLNYSIQRPQTSGWNTLF